MKLIKGFGSQSNKAKAFIVQNDRYMNRLSQKVLNKKKNNNNNFT